MTSKYLLISWYRSHITRFWFDLLLLNSVTQYYFVYEAIWKIWTGDPGSKTQSFISGYLNALMWIIVFVVPTMTDDYGVTEIIFTWITTLHSHSLGSIDTFLWHFFRCLMKYRLLISEIRRYQNPLSHFNRDTLRKTQINSRDWWSADNKIWYFFSEHYYFQFLWYIVDAIHWIYCELVISNCGFWSIESNSWLQF